MVKMYFKAYRNNLFQVIHVACRGVLLQELIHLTEEYLYNQTWDIEDNLQDIVPYQKSLFQSLHKNKDILDRYVGPDFLPISSVHRMNWLVIPREYQQDFVDFWNILHSNIESMCDDDDWTDQCLFRDAFKIQDSKTRSRAWRMPWIELKGWNCVEIRSPLYSSSNREHHYELTTVVPLHHVHVMDGDEYDDCHSLFGNIHSLLLQTLALPGNTLNCVKPLDTIDLGDILYSKSQIDCRRKSKIQYKNGTSDRVFTLDHCWIISDSLPEGDFLAFHPNPEKTVHFFTLDHYGENIREMTMEEIQEQRAQQLVLDPIQRLVLKRALEQTESEENSKNAKKIKLN